MKRSFIFLGLLGALGGAGWLAVRTFFPQLIHKKVVTRNKRSPIPIQVFTAKKEPIANKRKVSGIIRAIQSVSIVAEVQGRVVKINFKQGDRVEKDQLLIQLDSSQAMAQLHEAEAHLKLAKANYQRQRLLFQKKYGSEAALEKAEADRSAAIAAKEKAMVNLKYTRITAPFEGEIGFTNLSVGSQATPHQEITKLVSTQPMAVEFQIPEVDVKHVQKQQQVDVFAEGYDSLPTEATITAVEPYSDPISHTVKVKAEMNNSDNKFRDGAFAMVTMTLTQDERALVVPKEAIFREKDQDFVFVIIENHSRQRQVVLGVSEDSRVQITNGLAVGEIVAIDPVDLLMDGSLVRIDSST